MVWRRLLWYPEVPLQTLQRVNPPYGVEGIFDVQRHQEAHGPREVLSLPCALGCLHYLLDIINAGPSCPKAILPLGQVACSSYNSL